MFDRLNVSQLYFDRGKLLTFALSDSGLAWRNHHWHDESVRR